MAGIDPSIILRGSERSVRPVDPLDQYSKSMALQGLMGQQDLQSMQLQQARQGVEDESADRAALIESGGDNTRYRALLAGRGLGKRVQALDKFALEQQKTQAGIDKDRAQGAKAAWEVEKDKIQQGAALWDMAKDPESFASVLRFGVMNGTFDTKIATQLEQRGYSPQLVDALKTQGLTRAQQLEAQNRDRTFAHTQANAPFTAGPNGPVANEPVQTFQTNKARAGSTAVNVNTGQLTPGKPAQTKIDEGLLDTTSRLQRLGSIEQGYKPEFQQIAPRLSNTWASIKEKAGQNLSPADQKSLSEFSAFKRNAIDNLSQYIKEVTGAAMGVQEAERIMRGMPNPGTGVFDGDSPTEFKSKMDEVIRQTRMAEARLVYMKRNGFSLSDARGNKVPELTEMPGIMNSRGAELEKQLKASNPQAKPEEVKKTVRRQLAQEFGLVYE